MSEFNLQVVTVCGLGFMACHVVVRLLRRKTLTNLGVIFVGLGVLIGPEATGLLTDETMSALTPLVRSLLGWVALVVGLNVSLRADGGLIPGCLRAGFLYTTVGLIGFVTLAFGLMSSLLGANDDVQGWLLPAWVLGTVALSAAPGGMLIVARRYGAHGPVCSSGASLAHVSRVFAIITFTAAVVLSGDELVLSGLRPIAPVERLIGECILGIGLGLAADAFLGDEPKERSMVVILLSLSIVATGITWSLGMSPLLVNMVMGLSVANYGHLSATRLGAVQIIERPCRQVFLVFVGALWVPSASFGLWLTVVLLVLARLMLLRIGGGVAGRAIDPANHGLRTVGFTMLAQGAPALALALAFALVAPASMTQPVLSAVIVMAGLNDILAPNIARLVLDEAGEIPTLRTET